MIASVNAAIAAALLISGTALAGAAIGDDARFNSEPGAQGGAQSHPLSVQFLTGASPLPHPVSTAFYAPSEWAARNETALEGVLVITPDAPSGLNVLRDRFGFEGLPDTAIGIPPVIETAFVLQGEYLLPQQRGLTLTDHPFWDYVLTPGRVWAEPGEGGWLRAALPFALVEKNANCVHNGLVTFLIAPDGQASRAAWQVGAETCAYFQFDAWGVSSVEWRPEPVADAGDIRARDEAERDARLPVRPVSALADAFPGIDVHAFGSAEDVDPAAMTAFGLVAGGVHYTGGCETRFGAYPFCDEMVLPSYSLAKSLFGGLGLMQLEARHPGARNALIGDYVPECAGYGDWSQVTFEHALNMATGHFQSTEPDADENGAVEADFFLVGSHAEKAHLACSRYPRREAPGRTFVYQTTATYLLGAAMQAFFQEREGADADIYRDLLVDPLWRPLGLSQTLHETRRTSDERAQPFVGWGLVMQRGDLARLLTFIGTDLGAADGRALIDPDALRAALHRDPHRQGLPAPEAPLFYKDAFWAYNIQAYGGCGRETLIPFMSGFGGIAGVMIPNGTAYYYVSDGHQYQWARAVIATESISPFCTGPNP